MPPVTPFFADFHRRLFGKAPLSGLQERLRHSSQVPSISHYQELFGKLVPQEFLAPQKRGANSLIRRGQDLECSVFSQAIRSHLENRVLVYNNKTVVFD